MHPQSTHTTLHYGSPRGGESLCCFPDFVFISTRQRHGVSTLGESLGNGGTQPIDSAYAYDQDTGAPRRGSQFTFRHFVVHSEFKRAVSERRSARRYPFTWQAPDSL